ncbi:uncharacterized protein LOC109860819 isoform X2 [Pseudomyrmex gracilis]|uniref:uncharacterized protein LOC109860819 isoform X2 n=1 Tax=Pseudomyrmex gracilis TaxID=219809 RepID=UPI0009949251|nr:uncharacterized protein LOC109860819 isoform X2 [Pseudomyrmex gracilis]
MSISLMQDKIINADVELEEADMELESLEFANKELEQNLTELQHEIQRHKTLSLHSIHSEDLICLKKIRQLAQEELKLKTYIKELENIEDMYRRQMNKMLSCKELQRDNKRTTECMQKLEDGSKELQCPLDVYNKHNVTRQIYAFKDKKQETSKRTKARKKYSSLPYCVPLIVHASRTATNKSRACELCCKYCRQISSATLKSKSPCLINHLCEFPLSVASDVLQSSKQMTLSSVPCESDKTCNECEIATACKHINSCKCNCKRICASKLSTLPCDYSVISLSKTYQSTEVDNGNSDEEFCECCSCGDESSENLL